MSDEPQVVRYAARIDESVVKLPLGPRSVVAAARALGWETRAFGSAVTFPPVKYLAASDGHEAGDVRFPVKEIEHTVIQAKAAGARLGFKATWATTGSKTSFESALVYDPLGIFVEEIADYSANEYMVKLHGADEAEQIAWTRGATYNQGTLRRGFTVLYQAITPFFEWLNEWLEMQTPTHKKLGRKVKETTKPEPLALGDTEWSAA